MTDKRLSIGVLIAIGVLLAGGWLLLRPSTRAAAVYYVALNGSNSGDGSAARPWRNLNYAVVRLQAGDTLCIGAGVWTGGADVIDSQTQAPFPSGTDAGAGAVTIGGCNGEVPTIKPPDGLSGIRLTTGAPHFVVFRDLTIDGSLASDQLNRPELLYVASGSHHDRFERITFEHAMGNAILFSTGNAAIDQVTALEVSGSTFRDIGNASGDSGHGGPGKNNGYAVYDTSRGNVYLGNVVEDVRGFGFNIYGSDHVVTRNTFSRTATRGGGGAALNFGSSAHPVASANNVAANNVFHDTPVALMMYTSSTTFAYNNTFYNNGLGIQLQYCTAGTFQNNLFQRNGTDWMNFSPECTVTASNNLPSSTDAKLADPAKGDWHLKDASSPAVNAGTAIAGMGADYYGVVRPQAGTFDIGAAEFVAADSSGPVPVGTRPVLIPALSNVVTAVTAAPAVLESAICHNATGDRVYLQLFDAGGVQRAGASLPAWAIGIGPGDTPPLTGLGLTFANSVRAAVTRTATGAEAPASGIACAFGVRE